MTEHHRPIWDRGEAIDPEMLSYTIGDDWLQDQRLVEHDIAGSLAHVAGLVHAGLLEDEAGQRISKGLRELLDEYRAGSWQLTPADEDVHSAVERLLTAKIGEDGGRMHLGRSRNDQVTVDVRLWLRAASADAIAATEQLIASLQELESAHGSLPLPGYTHLRRAMPSSIGDWLGAHRASFAADLDALRDAQKRGRFCPLGSGSGYGIPLPLDRGFVAEQLGFDGPEEPVTAVQHGRGRPELAYLSALEGLAISLGKLAADLWLYSSAEFGFVVLPTEFTTGSSLMPQKRNPDLIELLRAQCRQVLADRAALLAVIQDLPSGYHRDFQLIKPPLFRGHDRALASVRITARLVPALQFDTETLQQAAADPQLAATAKALQAAAEGGQSFRSAYREEAGSEN
ncbi:MAG: argininosuccinate lyase [Planctomycetes bacterium]|nr:argininosuccinate lyase [Planctomycetota bacterium]